MKREDLLVLDYAVNNGVARIALDRTAARNAMNQDVADELYDVAQRVSNDPTVRAVLFVGNGKVFSVGGDIDVFASTPADELPETLTRMAGRYHDALRTFARLEVPIVSAVQGAVAGGALGLIYISDIVLAAEGTKFATGFGAIGLSGDGGNSWFLPRLVGTRRAAELYFEDRVLDAREAADWGLATRVVQGADLTDHADGVVNRLAAGPTKAYGAMRQLFWQSSITSLADQLADEVAALGRVSATADTVNAVASFTNKQQPTFEGK